MKLHHYLFLCSRIHQARFLKLDELPVQQCLLSKGGDTEINKIMDRVINDNLSHQ